MARTAQPTIRLARTADAAPIACMSRRYIEASLQWNWRAPRVLGHITSATSNVAVAEQRGNDQQNQMAGFAIMQFDVNVAALCLLAVNPQCRRLGIAARLVRWLEVTADAAGLQSIHVEAREDNEAAHGLYDALGFKLQQRLPSYYASGIAAMRFEKRLRPVFQQRWSAFGHPV